MKKILLVITAVLMLFVGCVNSNGRMIPDNTLKHMLVDIAFMDAYVGSVGINLSKDSIEAFAPIFKKYGYSDLDLSYTLAQHSMRNSKVLQNMIENAIEELTKEQVVVKWRNDLNDKWIASASKHYEREIFSSLDSFALTSADSLHLVNFSIPIPHEGKLTVSYRYSQDSSDMNTVRYFRYHLKDSVTSKTVKNSTAWIAASKNNFKKFSRVIDLKDKNELVNQLSFELIYFGNSNRKILPPNISFDSLTVLYAPPVSDAVEMYMYEKSGLDSLNNLVNSYIKEAQPVFGREWWAVEDDSVKIKLQLREQMIADSLREEYIDSLAIELAKKSEIKR